MFWPTRIILADGCWLSTREKFGIPTRSLSTKSSGYSIWVSFPFDSNAMTLKFMSIFLRSSSHRCTAWAVFANQWLCRSHGLWRAGHEAGQGYDSLLAEASADLHSRGDAGTLEGGSLCQAAIHLQHGLDIVQAFRQGETQEQSKTNLKWPRDSHSELETFFRCSSMATTWKSSTSICQLKSCHRIMVSRLLRIIRNKFRSFSIHRWHFARNQLLG